MRESYRGMKTTVFGCFIRLREADLLTKKGLSPSRRRPVTFLSQPSEFGRIRRRMLIRLGRFAHDEWHGERRMSWTEPSECQE
jgi:hypothetical protein